MSAPRANEPWLTIIGIGDDGAESLTPAARALLDAAETVIAPDRVLERVLAAMTLPGKRIEPWTGRLHETVEDLVRRRGERITILATGDPMHFGIGATMARRIPIGEMRIVPSPSAFSLAASRMGWAVQDVDCISLHGRAVAQLRLFLAPGNRILALTSHGGTVRDAAKLMIEAGFWRSRMTILEHMGGAAEKRVELAASEAVGAAFADFNTLAVECIADDGAAWRSRVPGLPDDAFVHDGQITKREVRAATLARLGPHPGGLLWDIGAGCGSVSIEWMRAARGARAIAIERSAERRAMIAGNAIALGVPSLTVVEGEAPDALSGLEAPDAVFIGGGLSQLVFETAFESLKSGGALVANAVTLDGEARLLALREAHGGELARIAVSRAEPLGGHMAWRALMPVTVWSLTKGGAR
jgi:precorrin-6B C5,15-methyltransferase / cobalt-precorrin-6B C5,C15-methyltransferase